jgi:hypothetical protein
MAGESRLEEYFTTRTRKAKGKTRKVKWVGRRGAPDRLLWLPDMQFPVLVELKAIDGVLKLHQKREHKRLRKMGFQVFVWWTKEQIDNFIRLPK